MKAFLSSCFFHILYTTDSMPGLAVNHSLMIRDDETPLDDLAGKPLYEAVWAADFRKN